MRREPIDAKNAAERTVTDVRRRAIVGRLGLGAPSETHWKTMTTVCPNLYSNPLGSLVFFVPLGSANPHNSSLFSNLFGNLSHQVWHFGVR